MRSTWRPKAEATEDHTILFVIDLNQLIIIILLWQCSASVFGVSANSMQCSYDQRGNSLPTILLIMQKRLYSEGGLQAEGIFRVNAENSREEQVRNQLNKGLVPCEIDVHCLAGLIKEASRRSNNWKQVQLRVMYTALAWSYWNSYCVE